jgi:hypothetical protein
MVAFWYIIAAGDVHNLIAALLVNVALFIAISFLNVYIRLVWKCYQNIICINYSEEECTPAAGSTCGVEDGVGVLYSGIRCGELVRPLPISQSPWWLILTLHVRSQSYYKPISEAGTDESGLASGHWIINVSTYPLVFCFPVPNILPFCNLAIHGDFVEDVHQFLPLPGVLHQFIM